MRTALLVGLLWLTGCIDSTAVHCGDITCPTATHCGADNECIPDTCGNGRIDLLEECDGNDSIDTTTLRCTDYGFYAGAELTCTETCVVDTSTCREFCGDHIVNGSERCDGIPPTGFACSDFGFEAGAIGCADSCTPAFDACASIGWQLVPGGGHDELYAVAVAGPETGVAVGRAGEVVAVVGGVWLPVSQTVTSDDLNDVIVTVDGIIAVGNNGTIIHGDGTTIVKMPVPVSAETVNLRGISGGMSGAIAVGDGGTILGFDGTSWSPMSSPTTEDLYAVHVIAPGVAYAVGANATILRLTGMTWSLLTPTGIPAVTLYAVFAVDGAVFVAGGSTTVARLLTSSTAVVAPIPFDVSSTLEMRALWAASPTDMFVAGANGVVLHWNGSYLAEHDTPTNRTIYSLDGGSGPDGVVDKLVGVTRGGTVIAFSGTSRHVSARGMSSLFAVFTDGVRVVAAGFDLVRLQSDGRYVLTVGIPTSQSVFLLGDDVYTGSQTQGLYKSSYQNGGMPANVSAAGVNGIWATTSPLRVVTVGDRVIESTDGVTFPQTTTTTVHGANTLRGVWAAPDGTWFAVGNSGVAIRRLPGQAWAVLPTGQPNDLIALWGTAADDVFVVGALGTILHWNGTAWRSMYTGVAENLVSISGNTRSDMFVTGTSFTRLHYDGISWSRMSSFDGDAVGVATFRGTTFYVGGNRIERSERVTSASEMRCGDPFDNDSSDGTNCDDPDCRDYLQCLRGGACETLERVTCATTNLATSTYTGVARINDLPCLDHSTPGPEASFRYIAEQSGPVTVTIEDTSHLLDLVATTATFGHCDIAECREATASGDSKTITFDATGGQAYYIVVDGPVGTAAPFTLTVSCE